MKYCRKEDDVFYHMMTKTKTKGECILYTGLNSLISLKAHDTHFPIEDKDKDKEKHKDKVTERPHMGYIF